MDRSNTELKGYHWGSVWEKHDGKFCWYNWVLPGFFFYPSSPHHAKCVGAMVTWNLWEWPNQCLVYLEVHTTRGGPWPILPGWPGTGDGVVQRSQNQWHGS